jgi:cytochrome c oxidase subunit 2
MTAFPELWPPRASTYAAEVDALMWGFTAVVALLSGPVFVLIAAFAIRYRRGIPANRRTRTNQSVLIETSWSVIPFLLTIGFLVYAAWIYLAQLRPPADAVTVDVVAKQWMWKFQHPEGQREINDLHVPAGQAVKLVMTSQDVIHSLYLPALRIKQDVLPGRYTTLWFKADRPGVYPIRCAEFCGLDHSGMGGRFYVLTPGDYSRWLQLSQTDLTLAGQGGTLYRRLGCGGCHDAGSTVPAPSLVGLYGAPVPLADGRVVKADAQYLHDSITAPNQDVAAGYRAVMPSYAGQLGEDQMAALVAYLQSLGGAPAGGSR